MLVFPGHFPLVIRTPTHRNVVCFHVNSIRFKVKLFCKHSGELHVVRGTCIADEYQSNCLDITQYLEDPDSLMLYYIIMRGVERFITDFNVYPGQFDDQVEPDVLKLKGIIGRMLAEWGCTLSMLRDELIHEVCR